MRTSRRKLSSSFKAKVTIEVLRERETIQQIAAHYEVHPTQVSSWKRQFLAGVQEAFDFSDENPGFGIFKPCRSCPVI